MKRFFLSLVALSLCASQVQALSTGTDRDDEYILRAVLDHYANELRNEAVVCVEPAVIAEPLHVLRTGWSLLKPDEHYSLSTRPFTERAPKEVSDALDELPSIAIRNKNFRVQPSWVKRPLRVRAQYDCDIGFAMQSPAVRGDLAVVHVRYHCGDGCGGTHLIGARREGQTWRAFAFSQQVIS